MSDGLRIQFILLIMPETFSMWSLFCDSPENKFLHFVLWYLQCHCSTYSATDFGNDAASSKPMQRENSKEWIGKICTLPWSIFSVSY